MSRGIRRVCKTLKKSMSLLLAFSMMISVCAISGFTFNVSAATSNGQKIYINTNQNSTWKSIPQLKVRMTDASGTKLSEELVSSSNRVFEATAPSGATRVEISSASFTLPDTIVPNGQQRIILKATSVNGKNYTTSPSKPYVHYYGSPTLSDTTWPGKTMTSLGDGYYYIDIDKSYTKVNFNDGQGNQTIDLTINHSYSSDTAYYNGSNWANPYVKVMDLTDITAGVDTEYYMLADGSFEKSKYISTKAADSQNVTYKTVYVINDNWNSLSKIYARFDYSDPYEGVVELTKTTVNGATMFMGKIPADASVKFCPQATGTNGASSTTTYPASSGYDGGDYTGSTATYKITVNSEIWAKLSDINNISYDAVVLDRFSKNTSGKNILGVEATYFDYISDNEMTNGYLNNQWNDRGAYNEGQGNAMWFPFSNFNEYISSIATDNSNWKYPLYFGNLYKDRNQYGYSDEVKNLSKYNDSDYRYAINNSNGLGNMNQSIQGLVYDRLDSNGNLQVANGVVSPYFDAEALSTAKWEGNRVAKVFKSYFPFRSTTEGGITEYTFDSSNAKDNVYFTWDGTTPKYVNYGAGSENNYAGKDNYYGITDEAYAFGGTADGYGIFPFNNRSHTSSQTIDGTTYTRGGNSEKDFGFGIRLDIEFRVPEYGTVNGTSTGAPVKFTYSGDDDLWVFIGENESGADAELVLDLGGDHKQATGEINFATMTATANDVYANYSSGIDVADDEFLIRSDSNTYYLYLFDSSTTSASTTKTLTTKETRGGKSFFVVKKSDLADYKKCIFKPNQNDWSGQTGNLVIDDLLGGMWSTDGSAYTGSSSTNLGKQTKVFGQSYGVNSRSTIKNLDPNKTYHMTVFYMERGLSESNFNVGFTMTPANNDLKVTKTLDTSNVIPAISDELKANETFDYNITDGSDATGKAYSLNGESATLGTSGSFQLQNSGYADFNNTFKTGSSMTVNETLTNTKLSYDTKWELINSKLGATVSSAGDSTKSTFNLVDPTDSDEYAQLELAYTNSVKTSSLALTKQVYDVDKTTEYNTDQQFTFKLALDLDGDGTKYSSKTYPLEYTIGNDSTVYRMAENGEFTITKGQTINLRGIPVGATFTLEEKTAVGYLPFKAIVNDEEKDFSSGTMTDVMTSAPCTVVVGNSINPTNTTVQIKKTLDGGEYTGSMFSYTLSGLPAMDTKYTDENGNVVTSNSTVIRTPQTVTTPANGGVVTFDDAALLQFVEPGYYRYKITESFADSSNTENANYVMDESTIFVEIEVDSTGTPKAPTYYKVANSELAEIEKAENPDYTSIFDDNTFTTNVQTLTNKSKHGSATVIKKSQAESPVKDTKFALIKVSEKDIITDEVLQSIVKSNNHIITATTDDDGKAAFNNLVIFEDGQGEFTKSGDEVVWVTNDNYLTGSNKKQMYCLFEYSPAEGYNPNNVRQYFTLPKDGEYDVTFNYVDGLIVSPEASGSGMSIFFVIGLGIIGTGALLATAYIGYDRVQRKKRRAKHIALRR